MKNKCKEENKIYLYSIRSSTYSGIVGILVRYHVQVQVRSRSGVLPAKVGQYLSRIISGSYAFTIKRGGYLDGPTPWDTTYGVRASDNKQCKKINLIQYDLIGYGMRAENHDFRCKRHT